MIGVDYKPSKAMSSLHYWDNQHKRTKKLFPVYFILLS